MKLPQVLTDLVKAQNEWDSAAYANCFSEMADVQDEGHTHNGRKEIALWIARANEKYKTKMKPMAFEENGEYSILSAESSGTFPGSPIVLKYRMKIEDGLIQKLRITG